MKYLGNLLTVAVFISLACRSVHSKCCYTFTTQPLGPSSPSSFSATLTASSQVALNSQGKDYRAYIRFPPSFLVTTNDTFCTFGSTSSVNCQSSGQDTLVVSFPNITQILNSTLLSFNNGNIARRGDTTNSFRGVVVAPSSADEVAVNGETCVVNTTCAALAGSHSISPSTTQSNTNSNSSSSSSSSISSSNKGMIIGVSCGIAIVVLIAVCVVLRRNMTSASSTGLKHGESQYSLGNPSHSSSTVAYGGPNSYALYREKTLKRQQSVREFHKAAENMAISQEAATQRETRYMEAPPSVNFSDLQLVGIEGLTRDSSRKSNRSVPSEMILDRGMNTSEVYTAPFHKNDQVLDVVKRNNSSSVIRSNGDDNNRKNLKHATSSERLQNPPLTRSRSKSTRYPWAQAGQAQLLSASVSSPALVSAPVQRPTNRNASVRRTKSNYSGSSRYNHHMEGMDDLSRTKQLSSRSRPSLESELASSISLPPQRPPIIPTRSPSRREQQDSARAGTVSQPIKLLDDKASHGLYGYL